MKLIVLTLLMTINSYSYAKRISEAKYSIEAYFNHSQSYSYTDPYRNIHRKGQNLEKTVIDSIRNAKKSILLAVQEIRLPLIAQELINKKDLGVEIKVILENTYNHSVLEGDSLLDRGQDANHDTERQHELKALVDVNRDGYISKHELMTRDAVYMLRSHNIKIIDDLEDGSFGSGLMHHKFMVVDSRSVIISTANFTMSGIHGDMLDHNTRGNANSMLKINSPSVAKTFTKEFFEMWGSKSNNSGAKFGLGKTYRAPVKASVRNSKLLMQFSPTPRRLAYSKSVNGLIAKTLSKAKSEILMSLFVFSDQKIANTLRETKDKNDRLKIELLIERKFATRNYSELLDLWGLQIRDERCNFEYRNFPWSKPLKTAGVPHLAEGDLLHHKFAVIDEETVIVGSQNWSDSANHTNDENVLIIKDSHIAKLYKKEFKRLNSFSQLGPSTALLKRLRLLEQSCTSSY